MRGLLFLVALAACAAPAQQAAPPQVPPTTLTLPAIPYACDLRAVPVGTWAEYQRKVPGVNVMTEKVAAVSRGPDGITIETTPWPNFVTALLLDPGTRGEGRLKRITFQDGAYDPMDNPIDEKRQHFYRSLDGQMPVGEETVTVRAGTFGTKRYRYKTAWDETVDVWIDAAVWPLCVVKLEAELKQGWPDGNRFDYELTATGTGATAQITRPAIPYDSDALKKRGEAQRPRLPAAPGESAGERR